MNRIRFRYFWLIALVTGSLVALCTVTAVSLFREQALIAGVLRENVESRGAAVELEVCLKLLIAQERVCPESVNNTDLLDRARTLLQALDDYADKPEEQKLYKAMSAAYDKYIVMWKAVPPPDQPGRKDTIEEAIGLLETKVQKPCHEYWEFNNQLLDDSTRQHERVLHQLGLGMALVGGLGGFAGLVLGYGVARGLSRSIRRLQVQISDAAGKLGSPLPPVVLTQEGDFRELHEQIDLLTVRIESVVQELQQREREVLRAEQLAAVGQLATGVAHEVRNPLTSIKMLVQLALEDKTGLPRDDLWVIESEVRKMEHSLQTFLDFARPPKPERRLVNLHDVIGGVLGLTRGRSEKQKVEVRLFAPSEPINLAADAGQLQQVLVNLILNALDAMPGGGRLHLTLRVVGGWVEIEVSDTGHGIPVDLLPRLFKPFVSGRDTGLGLGLAISLRITEDHGGTIQVANRPGMGATFTIRLPVASPDVKTISPSAPGPLSPWRGG
jgi:two-component system, NtrC family, sensor histidine kinase HydH